MAGLTLEGAPTTHPHARCCWCKAPFSTSGSYWVCPTPACQRRQQAFGLGLHGKDGTKWLYLPLPRQVDFHAAPAPNVLFGGAAGPGKSHALRYDAYMRCLAYPGYSALLLRRTFPELKKTHMRSAEREQTFLSARFGATERMMRFANGSYLEFGHCETSQDVSKYLSTEYCWIGLDEITTFEWNDVLELMSRARTSDPRLTAMVRAATNPGGISGLAVRDFFIDGNANPEFYPEYDASEWSYIPAIWTDNPYLDPKYVKRLKALPAVRVKQLLEADWYCFEGQFFATWDEAYNVKDLGAVSEDVEWFRSLDWGYNAPGVCLWWACLPDGHYYVAHEYKFQYTAIPDVAARIEQQTRDLGIGVVRYTAADPATRQNSGQMGESIQETFAYHGVPLLSVRNDRVNGWQRLHTLFQPAPDGSPWLIVSPNCRYLVRTIPAAVQDEVDPDDLNTEGDDHGLDALRYGAMSRPAPTTLVDRTEPGRGTAGELFRKARFHKPAVLGSRNVRLGVR